MLALAAAAAPAGSEIVEIGTFDGRTALNLAINAPAGVSIATLDLPADQPSALAIEASERRYVDKPAPGARLARLRRAVAAVCRRACRAIVRGFRDLRLVAASSAGPGWCSSTARTPTTTPARIPKPRCGWCGRAAIVLWHDYGVWPGVTQALEELEAARGLGLVNIRGTSLVFWRAGQAR